MPQSEGFATLLEAQTVGAKLQNDPIQLAEAIGWGLLSGRMDS
jgi:hypothetical protein